MLVFLHFKWRVVDSIIELVLCYTQRYLGLQALSLFYSFEDFSYFIIFCISLHFLSSSVFFCRSKSWIALKIKKINIKTNKIICFALDCVCENDVLKDGCFCEGILLELKWMNAIHKPTWLSRLQIIWHRINCIFISNHMQEMASCSRDDWCKKKKKLPH